jgi:Zn-dependent M28 family amino/carboxypeptidase
MVTEEPGTDSGPATIDVAPARLSERLGRIVGERNPRTSPGHHAAVADLVHQTFLAAGLEVSEQPVASPFGSGRNIIGRLAGCQHPERVWILGAHYDTVTGTPGADDNGVAVAGLLEAAELLAGYRCRDTIELVAWDLEEPQALHPVITRGSRTMAREIRAARQALQGVLVLEMIGCCRYEPGSQKFPPGFGLLFPGLKRWVAARQNRGDFLAVVGNPRSQPLVDAIGRAADRIGLPCAGIEVKGAARLIPDFYRSDHAPFWSRGYPAVMLTDTANFRSRHYHRRSDTADTLDLQFASRVMIAAIEALVMLAGGRARTG